MSENNFLVVAKEAALSAGKIILDKLGKVGYREKHRADLVTEADVKSQEAIQSILLDAFPDHCFLGEETPDSELVLNDVPEFCWIVDPLDGTTNFVHGFPMFCTSIALACRNELISGVIYDPNNDVLYTAEKGQGAFRNGVRIQTGSIVKPEEALISAAFPTSPTPDSPDFLAFAKLVSWGHAVRRVGTTALNLSFLASGHFDLMTCFSAKVWDVAAGVLLVQEAGGIVSAQDGSPFSLMNPKICVAATPELHRALLKRLAEK